MPNKEELTIDLEKAELRIRSLDDELAVRDGAMATIKKDLASTRKDLVAAKKAGKGKKTADGTGGLMPIALFVGGVEWNGTLCCLVRAGTSGKMAKKWLVRRGNKMATVGGQWIPFVPYWQVRKSLQDKVLFDLEAGIEHLSK